MKINVTYTILFTAGILLTATVYASTDNNVCYNGHHCKHVSDPRTTYIPNCPKGKNCTGTVTVYRDKDGNVTGYAEQNNNITVYRDKNWNVTGSTEEVQRKN